MVSVWCEVSPCVVSAMWCAKGYERGTKKGTKKGTTVRKGNEKGNDRTKRHATLRRPDTPDGLR